MTHGTSSFATEVETQKADVLDRLSHHARQSLESRGVDMTSLSKIFTLPTEQDLRVILNGYYPANSLVHEEKLRAALDEALPHDGSEAAAQKRKNNSRVAHLNETFQITPKIGCKSFTLVGGLKLPAFRVGGQPSAVTAFEANSEEESDDDGDDQEPEWGLGAPRAGSPVGSTFSEPASPYYPNPETSAQNSISGAEMTKNDSQYHTRHCQTQLSQTRRPTHPTHASQSIAGGTGSASAARNSTDITQPTMHKSYDKHFESGGWLSLDAEGDDD